MEHKFTKRCIYLHLMWHRIACSPFLIWGYTSRSRDSTVHKGTFTKAVHQILVVKFRKWPIYIKKTQKTERSSVWSSLVWCMKFIFFFGLIFERAKDWSFSPRNTWKFWKQIIWIMIAIKAARTTQWTTAHMIDQRVYSWISKQSWRNCLSDMYHTVDNATFSVTFFPSK